MNCIWDVPPEKRHCKYCLLTHCEDRVTEKYRRHGKVTEKIRALKVGQEITMDASYLCACRGVAYRMRDDFGVKILVKMQSDGVHVTRFS